MIVNSVDPVAAGPATSEAEHALADFFENASVPLHWVGPDGTILRVNRAELELLGYPREEYLGRHIAEFHADRSIIDDMLARLARGETLRHHPARMRCRDGTIRHVLVNSNARFEDGRFIHTRCITIDVTDQRRVEDALRQSEARFRTLADAVPVMIANCDAEARFKFVNKPYAERFGLSPEQVIGRRIPEVVGEGAFAAFETYVAETLAGRAVQFEVEIPYRTGGTQFMRCAYMPEHDGNGRVVGLFAAIVNITERKRAEEQLRASEERYRRLAELLPVGVYTCEAPSGTITYYNDHATRLWGRTPRPGDTGERFCGSHRLFRSDGTSLPHAECAMAVVLRDGQAFRNHEVIVERPDGSRVVVLVNIDPIHDSSGRLVGAVNVFHDITAVKQAELALREQKENLQTLLETLPVAVFIADDPQCRRISGNRAAAALLRMAPDENFSKSAPGGEQPLHFEILKDGQVLEGDALPIQRAARGEIVAGESLDVAFRDGTIAHTLVSAQPLYEADGRPRGAVASILDITELKNAELALREADRRKDEFLATLSHELRNPLAPIRTALAVLGDSRGEPARFEAMTRVMERQLAQHVRLIDDLLDVSRISRGTIDLKREPVDLRVIVGQAVEARRLPHEPGRPAIVVSVPEEPLVVDADAVRLGQVFSNLLNNACKYTPRDGSIHLVAERREGDVVVSVRDTGIGIPQEQLDTIFEMFAQVDPSRERSHGGLGIGLSLARRLVHLHGGTIEARSAGTGHGSEFIVRLPLHAGSGDRAARGEHGAPHDRPPQAGERILVVDDNADAASMLAALLELHGHSVETAYDGAEAIGCAEAFRPSIVLLDIGLPRMDGNEVCRWIRRQPWGERILIIALTGWGQDEDRTRSAEAGFDLHLVKPVAPETLSAAIAAHLQRPTR